VEYDDLSQSGIRRVADYSPYLDQLAGLASEMGLKQRSNLVHLERCLHSEWALGQNSIISWTPIDEGILVLVVPHYAIAEYTANNNDEDDLSQQVSARFITELISGDRQLTLTQMQKVARLLNVEPKIITLRQPLSAHPVEIQIVGLPDVFDDVLAELLISGSGSDSNMPAFRDGVGRPYGR
jgi:hypothetical protein